MDPLSRAVAARSLAANHLLTAVQWTVIEDQDFSLGHGLRQNILPEPLGSEWHDLLDRIGEKQ
jgi:hypothetical protein